MSTHRYIGDYVSIQFVSSDATTAAAIVLKDANDAVVTLKANERLLIDTLTGTLDPAVVTGIITLFADANNDGNVDTNEGTVAFTYTISTFSGGPEGFPFPIGLTPKVKANTAGAVRIGGTGRTMKGQTEGLRPSWKESLIGGLGGYLNVTKP